MNAVNLLLPKIELLGHWIYWFILLASTLESTAVIGLIFPGTTIIIFAGYLASQRIVDVGDVIWFVALGGIIGDAISFYLGKKGIHLFKNEAKWLKRSHLAKGEEFFKRHGSKSIFLARFIGPLRPLIPFVGGLSKMDTKRFFIYNILGGFAAAIFYVLLGYFFGHAWREVRHILHRFEGGAVIVIIAMLAGYIIWHKVYEDN